MCKFMIKQYLFHKYHNNRKTFFALVEQIFTIHSETNKSLNAVRAKLNQNDKKPSIHCKVN